MDVATTRWYGWIPTNRGKINFYFVKPPSFLISQNTSKHQDKKNINYTNLDISYLSDSYGYKKFLKLTHKSKVEYPATANVSFVLNSPQIDGDVEIVYEKFCTLKSNFSIDSNGVVAFQNINYDIDSIENELQEIKTLLYVLVKTLVHGDAHHHQKIDIALPIMENEFNPKIVSSSLADYIKLAEKNTKSTNHCESLYRNENIVYEIDGYLSYFKSFMLLFDDAEVKKEYEFACSVVASLKSTVLKRKNKVDFINGIVAAVIAFTGLFISMNILLNGFWLPKCNDITCYLSFHNRFYYLLGSFIVVMIVFLKYTKCKFVSYVYYHWYEFFEFTRLIKNARFRDLNLEGKLIKLTPFYLLLGATTTLFYSIGLI